MNIQTTELHPQDHPNAKLARLGPEALSDKELLAVILGAGRATARSIDQASKVAALPAGLKAFSSASLVRDSGLGGRTAAALTACLELGRRNHGGRDGRPVLDSPASVVHLIPMTVRAARKEHFLAFYLNARSQVVHSETVSIGTLSASLVHPREVFAPGISSSAAAIVVAHNHPSGDCTPSAEDRDATRRLLRAGELLGISLLDHVIVSETGFFSFKEHGLLA